MIASEAFFTILVTIGVAVTAVAPVALLILLVRDWITGRLW